MKVISECKCPLCKSLFRVESPETDLDKEYVEDIIVKKLQDNFAEHIFALHKEEIKWQKSADQQN
jgi:hypothetical protein